MTNKRIKEEIQKLLDDNLEGYSFRAEVLDDNILIINGNNTAVLCLNRAYNMRQREINQIINVCIRDKDKLSKE